MSKRRVIRIAAGRTGIPGQSEVTVCERDLASMAKIQAALVFLICAVESTGGSSGTYIPNRLTDKDTGEDIGEWSITVRREN